MSVQRRDNLRGGHSGQLMSMRLTALFAGALLLLAAACDTNGRAAGVAGPGGGGGGGSTTGGQDYVPDPDAPPVYVQSLAALTAVDDCSALAEELKANAIRDMEERLDETMANLLEWGVCDYYWWDMDCDYGGGMPVPAGHARNEEGASEYSTTNNQVAGVAEADFVKNDGSHIFIIADGRFQIIDAWPPEEAHVIASRGIEGEAKRLFVHADRAVVYSSLEYLPRPNTDPYGYRYSYGYGGGGDCTYGYNCDFTGDGRGAKMTVFDISDRSAPELVREITLSGSYINSRRIGEAVHTVAFFPGAVFPGVSYYPEELTDLCNEMYEDWDWRGDYESRPTVDEETVRALFEALKAENREIIENSSIVDFLPGVRDTRYIDGRPVTEEGLLESCRNFYVSQTPDGDSYLGLLSFDMTSLGELGATTIVGNPGAVYASADALYVAARHRSMGGMPWFWEGDDAPQEASSVHKFDLLNDPPRSFYAGSGVVKGRVLNQFSMDEFEGHLRIATTTGRVPQPDVHSTVTVLHEHGGQLVETGRVDDIAPTEDIRSVRFSGARGFIVTFKKTDPLFALDLADPIRPRILGELKIPGYSTYMHIMDDDHVLSIGYDADDQGDFAWFTGIQLQIFDVSDMRDPRRIHHEIIGSRGSTSDAATDHLAFNYFPQRDLLAIPMTVCEGGHGGSYGDRMTFSGLMVYRTTARSGFDYLGGVEHQEPETADDYYGACNNWWTNSNSLVKRSIFMDDYVFSITEEEIKVDLVHNLGVDVAQIDLLQQ